MIHSMPCRNLCRLYIHPSCIHLLSWSLKHSVEVNLVRLHLFHQWECLKFNWHGLSFTWVKWPLDDEREQDYSQLLATIPDKRAGYHTLPDKFILTLKGQCKPHGLGIILGASCSKLLLHCTKLDLNAKSSTLERSILPHNRANVHQKS